MNGIKLCLVVTFSTLLATSFFLSNYLTPEPNLPRTLSFFEKQQRHCQSALRQFRLHRDTAHLRKRLVKQTTNKHMCFLTVATGKYFVLAMNNLTISLSKHVVCRPDLNDCTFVHIVFTDKDNIGKFRPGKFQQHVQLMPASWMKWPFSTIKRFDDYLTAAPNLLQNCTSISAVDADLSFHSDVYPEDLATRGLYGVIHPSFMRSKNRPAYENKQNESTAFVPPGAGCYYFTGAHWGGSKAVFLSAAEEMSKRVGEDFRRSVVAQFHDESQLNRYFIDYPPLLILPPSFYMPEDEIGEHHLRFFPKKILALRKNHSIIRSFV